MINIGQKFTLGEDGEKIQDAIGYRSVGDFIGIIIPNIMMISGIILFFLLLFGGFLIITNSGDVEKQKQGSKAITTSIIGFIIIFSAYWILQLINVITGANLLNF